MKKRILLLLLITLAVCFALIPTEAEAVVWDQGYYNGLFWYISSDEYYRPASQGGGYTLHVSRSDPFDGAPDNLKKQSWEKYKNDIVAASISSDVSEISYGTFANMPVLSRVSIPDNVLYVHNSAFANCPNLRSITLPRSLRGLGTEAFANTGITSINIPTSVNEIGLNPFYGCNISKICYCGAAQQWNQISFVGDNNWADGVLSYHRWQDATCISFGETTYTCTVCNKTKTETGKVGAAHPPGDWIYASDQHYRQCTICNSLMETADHIWNSGAITKRPTCAEEGIWLHTCTVCNGTWEFYIDRLTEHIYDHPCDTECNVCGAIRTISHSYSSDWIKTTDRHYLECSICGAKQNSSIHTAGPAATETTPQTCTVCGYILSPVLNHSHKYEGSWSMNREGHWHACTGCEEQQSYGAHKFDNICDTDCNTCGFERFTSHTYGTVYQCDAEGHWFVCAFCGSKEDHSAHEPGPAPATTTAQTYTICGYEVAPPVPEATEPSAPTTKPVTTPATNPSASEKPTGSDPENTNTPR